MSTYLCIYIYTYIHICIYIHTYIYICIYICRVTGFVLCSDLLLLSCPSSLYRAIVCCVWCWLTFPPAFSCFFFVIFRLLPPCPVPLGRLDTCSTLADARRCFHDHIAYNGSCNADARRCCCRHRPYTCSALAGARRCCCCHRSYMNSSAADARRCRLLHRLYTYSALAGAHRCCCLGSLDTGSALVGARTCCCRRRFCTSSSLAGARRCCPHHRLYTCIALAGDRIGPWHCEALWLQQDGAQGQCRLACPCQTCWMCCPHPVLSCGQFHLGAHRLYAYQVVSSCWENACRITQAIDKHVLKQTCCQTNMFSSCPSLDDTKRLHKATVPCLAYVAPFSPSISSDTF